MYRLLSRENYISEHSYLLYVVVPIFVLVGACHIYLKQRLCLVPQIILVIINLVDAAFYSISLGIYIFLWRDIELDRNSTGLKTAGCLVILLAFFKSLDNILGQLDIYLAMSKPSKYTKVTGYFEKLQQSLKEFSSLSQTKELYYSLLL